MAKTNVATFLGPQLGLSIVGDHAYAYNTSNPVVSSTPILSFRTGKYYMVGKLIIVAPIKFASADIASGLITALEIKFNGTSIGFMKHETPNEDMSTTWMEILIPPQTNVVMNHVEDSTAAGYLVSISLVGRIYNA